MHAPTQHSGTSFARGMACVFGRAAAVAILAVALGSAPSLAQTDSSVPAAAITPSPDGPTVAQAAEPSASATPLAGDAVVPGGPPAEVSKATLPAPSKLQHDLTPMGMFLSADPIVQGVMILLAAASVLTWTVLFMKVFGLFLAKSRMRASIRTLREVDSLAQASGKLRPGVARCLLREAEEEVGLSRGLPSEGIKERVLIALQRVETASAKGMAVGTGVLATIGSIGPFVGLFGTVWGIMRSFIGIAQSNTTNLAVVAPGIAEALLATGIGLVAAIPAVVIYNALARSIGGFKMMTGDAVALIMRHLSRDLDRHEASPYAGPVSAVHVAAE